MGRRLSQSTMVINDFILVVITLPCFRETKENSSWLKGWKFANASITYV